MRLVIMDGGSGRVLHKAQVNPVYQYVGMPNDSWLQIDAEDTWTRLSLPDLRVISAGQENAAPGDLQYCCGYSPNGRYHVWAKYGWADLVDDSASAPIDQGGANPSHLTSEPVWEPDQFAVTNDGKEMALAGGGDLYIALAATATPDWNQHIRFDALQQLPGTGHITALTFLGGDQRLVSANGAALVLWSGSQVSRIAGGPVVDGPGCDNVGGPPNVAISANGNHLATAGELSQLTIENFAAPFSDLSVAAPRGAMPLWGPGYWLFLLGDDGQEYGGLVLYNGSIVSAWPEHSARDEVSNGMRYPGVVVAARLSPDSRRVVLVDDHGDIQVRQSSNGAIVHAIGGLPQQILPYIGNVPIGNITQNRAAISIGATTVAMVLPDGTVRVTDVRSGRHHDLPGPPASVVTFSASRLLVQGQDGNLREWNVTGTRLLRSIPGDSAYTASLAAIPRSDLIARLTEQGTVELTDLNSGQVLGTLAPPLPYTGGAPPWDSTTLAASPDGRDLVTATGCGSIVRWQLSPAAWIRTACTLADQDLTAAEWRQYVGTSPPANIASYPCRRPRPR